MSDRLKYDLEYSFNTSPKVLFARLATPSGLSEWFADDVFLENNIITFIWEKSKQKAELIDSKPNNFVKYRWIDSNDDEFFEFRLSKDDLTGDMALIITDFADDEEDKNDNIELWDKQIEGLKRILGLIR